MNNKFICKPTGSSFAICEVSNSLIRKMLDFTTTMMAKLALRNVGKNIKICHGFICRYPGNIKVGDNVYVGLNSSWTTELPMAQLEIEDGVSIVDDVNIDYSGGIIIGRDSHIAKCVNIVTHTHGYDYKSIPIGIHLHIKENVFIGQNATILPNVKYIGRNAVIGACSVVTKEVPDNAVVAGNPAKIIKFR